MILSLMLAAADPSTAQAAHIKQQAMHDSLFVFPILRDLVDAINENDEAKFSRHVQPGAVLTDRNGKMFPLRVSVLQTLVAKCTFTTIAASVGPVEDDGIVYWKCPDGMAQIHFKLIDGKVLTASPFRDPSTEGAR